MSAQMMALLRNRIYETAFLSAVIAEILWVVKLRSFLLPIFSEQQVQTDNQLGSQTVSY
jgi:hypothetical protein